MKSPNFEIFHVHLFFCYFVIASQRPPLQSFIPFIALKAPSSYQARRNVFEATGAQVMISKLQGQLQHTYWD